MDRLDRARDFFFRALEYHNANRWTEAEALYRSAYALVPERVSVLVNLAAVLIQQNRCAEALEFCRQAIAIEPAHPDALSNLALCSRELSASEESLALIERAVDANPTGAELHNIKGAILRDLGRFEDAIASFDRAHSLDPGRVDVLTNRGDLFAKLDRPDEAFACFRRALELDPACQPAGERLISLVLRFGLAPVGQSPDFEALAIRAISEPWARPVAVAPILVWLLRADENFRRWLDAVERAWPERLSPAEQTGLTARRDLFGNRLLIALMKSAVIADIRIERLLTALRYHMLQQVVRRAETDEWTPDELAFCCALAQHCFINEYLYSATPEEFQAAASLRDHVASGLGAGQPVDLWRLVAAAAYFPLCPLPSSERLLQSSWPGPVDALLTQQLREPLVERGLRPGIPQLSAIEDAVSRRVQQQYEENPYPRWTALPRPGGRQSLESYLRGRVPGAAPGPLSAGVSIHALNAGCGTGQDPIETASRVSGVELLAIDLSRTSLCYAQRMADRFGLPNLRFAQGDILQLASISTQYDLIESTGVLHHLRDPDRGLEILRSRLKPGGLMRLAVYSETARRCVAAARALISERGYLANEHDIRNCRDAILMLDDSSPAKRVTAFTDFYSMSECRDLLFHVQEHCFTIPQIKALLARLQLDFIGFELEAFRVAEFQRSFPDSSHIRDLDAWHEFELRNPDTFAGMYQFWVQSMARVLPS